MEAAVMVAVTVVERVAEAMGVAMEAEAMVAEKAVEATVAAKEVAATVAATEVEVMAEERVAAAMAVVVLGAPRFADRLHG